MFQYPVPRQILHNQYQFLSWVSSFIPTYTTTTNYSVALTSSPAVNNQTLYQTPVPVLSNEESIVPVPKAAILIYMVEAEKVITLTDHVREDVVLKKKTVNIRDSRQPESVLQTYRPRDTVDWMNTRSVEQRQT